VISTEGDLRDMQLEMYDYVLVPTKVWLLLVAWYGNDSQFQSTIIHRGEPQWNKWLKFMLENGADDDD